MRSDPRARSYPAGQAAAQMSTGDFILCHRAGLIPAIIRLGQGLRFRGDQRKYAYWNHAALILSADGEIVEALSTGVRAGSIERYRHVEYTLVRVGAQELDQRQIARFAGTILGERYGWATIACCALNILTGSGVSFGYQNQLICSGLVALAQLRAGACFDRLAQDILPADLARYYDAARPV